MRLHAVGVDRGPLGPMKRFMLLDTAYCGSAAKARFTVSSPNSANNGSTTTRFVVPFPPLKVRLFHFQKLTLASRCGRSSDREHLSQ